MKWRNAKDELPEQDELVLVSAWEFGYEPEYHICQFWQSVLPGQPGKFYLHDVVPNMELASQVRYWIPFAEFGASQPL